MSDLAVRVEGLGKRYRIGTAAERHDNVRDALTAAIKAPFRNLSRLRELPLLGSEEQSDETVWALKGVSFEVKQGDVLGIIGRNGAGKSTLLKILSRITEPTTGRVEVRGRVGALLEVGTGFHPELTGRENVYLNGSILGMDKRYIDRRFDEIVEFSGVEKFIDTPVKRYSSGMYLRLAFSVAAHLEPEILVVDEVLAVGDAEFQKKCMGKMGEVAGEGRTVLFVSHNMGAVTGLCSRAVLLSAGGIGDEGTASDVVQAYLAGGSRESSSRSWSINEAPGDESTRLLSVRVCQPSRIPAGRVDMQVPFSLEVEYEVDEPIEELNVAIIVSDKLGNDVIHTSHHLGSTNYTRVGTGRHVSVCTFPANALNSGDYWVTIGADEPFKRQVWLEEYALRFTVQMTHPSLARYREGSYRGVLGPALVEWERHSLGTAAP